MPKTASPSMTRSRVTPDTYHSEEFFRVEQERVWSCRWGAVGYEGRIPEIGDTRLIEIAELPLFLVCDRSGGFSGFRNVSRHCGSQLQKGVFFTASSLRRLLYGAFDVSSSVTGASIAAPQIS